MTDTSFQSIAVKEIQGSTKIVAGTIDSGEGLIIEDASTSKRQLKLMSYDGTLIRIKVGNSSTGLALETKDQSNLLVLNNNGKVLIGTNSSAGSGALEISSTTQGVILPRMTTAQRDAIASPVAGMVIYNTSTNKLNVYTTAWEAVTSA